jgi:hypothetical protein
LFKSGTLFAIGCYALSTLLTLSLRGYGIIPNDINHLMGMKTHGGGMKTQSSRSKVFPIVMVIAGLVLILGSLAWLVLSNQTATEQEADLPAPVGTPRIPFPTIKRISMSDAKAAFEIKSAVFVDVRGEPYYSEGHIPGAISMTDEEVPNRLGELDRKAWIITYCT